MVVLVGGSCDRCRHRDSLFTNFEAITDTEASSQSSHVHRKSCVALRSISQSCYFARSSARLVFRYYLRSQCPSTAKACTFEHCLAAFSLLGYRTDHHLASDHSFVCAANFAFPIHCFDSAGVGYFGSRLSFASK